MPRYKFVVYRELTEQVEIWIDAPGHGMAVESADETLERIKWNSKKANDLNYDWHDAPNAAITHRRSAVIEMES